MAQGLPVERLRAFLHGLGPEVQLRLVTALERNALAEGDFPGAALILEELRPVLRQARRPPPRVDNPSRLFFAPAEPFLVDRGQARVLSGRIERTSLEPIWNWIQNGLLPAQAQRFCEEIAGELADQDGAARARATRAFQDEVAVAIGPALARAATDDRAARRLAGEIRTERALDEVEALRIILTHQDALAYIAVRLPARLRPFGDDQADSVLSLLKQSLAGRSDATRFALILVAARLSTVHHLLRLAVRSSESDAAAKVAQSPYAVAVDMTLAEIRGAVGELQALCRRGLFAEALGPLKDIHDAIRAMRTELDLPADSAWGRELAAIRASVSDVLRVELESAPGWVRRLLRPRTARDSAGRLDDAEVAELEDRIGLAMACRSYAGELAVNLAAPRVVSELQAYIEGNATTLIEALRGCDGAERLFRQSQVDAAVRFSAKLFGAEYASLLGKAAAMAIDRKPERA